MPSRRGWSAMATEAVVPAAVTGKVAARNPADLTRAVHAPWGGRPARAWAEPGAQRKGERRMLGEAMPFTRLVELPGRGTTRVWECAGPPGAQTLMLIHGVTFTAELNWGRAFAPLGRHFRVVAADLRGHGDGIRLRSRFRLEDGADDIAALAGVLETGGFAAVGHSMGGLVAQLL